MVAQINSQDLKKAFSQATKTQVIEQPNLVDNRAVIPVVDVTPLNYVVTDIVASGAAVNASSATVISLDSKRTFYLVAATMSTIKDVTATSTSTRLLATINGLSTRLLSIEGITLTVQDRSVSVSFPSPIKIDKGTNITLTNTSATANVTSHAIVYGYYQDEM